MFFLIVRMHSANDGQRAPNLTFLFKVIERSVSLHVSKYLINNNLNASLKYAFKGHIIETALFWVKKYYIIMYTRPLGIIAQRYRIKYYLYADDTQLYHWILTMS